MSIKDMVYDLDDTLCWMDNSDMGSTKMLTQVMFRLLCLSKRAAWSASWRDIPPGAIERLSELRWSIAKRSVSVQQVVDVIETVVEQLNDEQTRRRGVA